jgi:ABC-2 type transport system permease protein/Cu-processing system permease protein
MSFAFASADSAGMMSVLLREFRAVLINRYCQVFAAIALAGGLAAALFTEDSNAVVFFVLQIALYLVSLFALLAGVSSAQMDQNEWQLMFAQPVARAVYPLAKFAAYISIFSAGLLLLFVPAALAGSHPSMLLLIYAHTLLLAGCFLALGLTAGFLAHDRSTALMIGVSGWLALVFLVDLTGLFAARLSIVQQYPDIWVALLMLNPLDAFRIHALFALEQIPPEAANKTALAAWWIAHAGLWFVIIATIWSGTLLAVAIRYLNRREE